MKIKIQKNKGWNLWEHGVTQSFIQSFLTDPYQCKLRFVDLWTPVQNPEYFIFGSCVHYVIEQVLLTKEFPSSIKIKELIDKWFSDNILSKNQEIDYLEKIKDVFERVEAALLIYFKKYATDIKKDWYEIEEKFAVDYYYPDGKKTILTGKRDLVERFNLDLILYDTKCYSRWSKEEELILLPVNFQLNFYGYTLVEQYGYLYDVSQIILNIIKKTAHKKTAGISLSSKIQAAYLENLDEYFIRETIPFSRQIALDWKRNQLDPIMLAIRKWFESGFEPNYYNPLALQNKYGLTEFARFIVENDTKGYYKRDLVFEELN